MAQRIEEEFSVIVPLVLTVENQGHNVAPNFPGDAAQAGKQFRISLVQIALRLTVRLENVPGWLASPAKSLDQSCCMPLSEIIRDLQEKLVIESSSRTGLLVKEWKGLLSDCLNV
jgi:hypothetical protein